MSEVAAYGTAVYIVPIDQPQQQHVAQAHQAPPQQQQYAHQQQPQR
jgi:hypothetical protein